jgi:hypothetical protein
MYEGLLYEPYVSYVAMRAAIFEILVLVRY